MSLHTEIKSAMTDALKAKDEVRLQVLRSVATEITNTLVANKHKPDEELDDEAVLAVIKREAKKRREAHEQFTNAGRDELAAREHAELQILEDYLPEMMSIDEIQAIASAKKDELGITVATGKGQLMAALMQDLKGKAEGGDVKQVVDDLLS